MKSTYQRDTYMPIFIVAVFTIGKIWDQPTLTPTDKWIIKCIHIMEHFSTIKKNEIICSKIDGTEGY
jgi:hypothetical protein